MVRYTLANTSGIVWLSLLSHVGGGMVAIVSGYVALAVAKGGRAHKRSGTWFVYAMLVAGVVGSVLSATEGKMATAIGGSLAGYLVLTATRAVLPPHRRV